MPPKGGRGYAPYNESRSLKVNSPLFSGYAKAVDNQLVSALALREMKPETVRKIAGEQGFTRLVEDGYTYQPEDDTLFLVFSSPQMEPDS